MQRNSFDYHNIYGCIGIPTWTLMSKISHDIKFSRKIISWTRNILFNMIMYDNPHLRFWSNKLCLWFGTVLKGMYSLDLGTNRLSFIERLKTLFSAAVLRYFNIRSWNYLYYAIPLLPADMINVIGINYVWWARSSESLANYKTPIAETDIWHGLMSVDFLEYQQ